MENTTLPEVSTSQIEQILKENNLDFTISKRENRDPEGTFSGFYGLWNDKLNKCLHNVREGYVVSQNAEVIKMVLQSISQFGNLKIHKAGVINDGCRIFVQVEMHGYDQVGNDYIKRYITIIDSNDGSASLSVGIGDVTLSCMNQFWRFYNAGLKLRHTASIERKLKELPKMIEMAMTQSNEQLRLYSRMSEIKQTDNIVHGVVNAVLGYDRKSMTTEELSKKSQRSIDKMDMLYNCIESEMAEKGQTLWGIHSGVTFFTTHKLKTPKRENGHTESLMLGTGGRMNAASLKYLSQFAK